MCSILQYIGGKDDNETCRKILCNLITNELAIHTNWTGRNEKNGFKDIKNLIQLIHVSVRKYPVKGLYN
ncbi:hypothetical protein JTB14_015636 [Gonioctena quinquepunctata]|nr:hypothetical protein JTB14_015636 [Gonioctena quinquepunctata]